MDPVRLEFSLHDRYQVEIKFDFPLNKQDQHSRFRIESYLFLPASIGINPDSYTREYFYRDFSSLTRYDVPSLSLQQVLDTGLEISPLSRLVVMQNPIRRDNGRVSGSAGKAVRYELCVLGCIARERILDCVRATYERLTPPISKAGWNANWLEETCELAGACFEQVEKVEQRLRSLKREYAAMTQDREVLESFEYVDEAISIECQRAAAQIAAMLANAREKDAPLGGPNALSLLKTLPSLYEREEKHREQAGYPSMLEEEKGVTAQHINEHLIYRQGLLRNYCHDVLMLTTFTQPGSKSMQTLLNAMAAMAAMFVFLVVLYFVQKRVSADGLLYLALPVLAYALKDRVKDGLKLAFAKRATGMLRDHEVELIDRRTDPLLVGKVYDVFNFVVFKKLPDDIREIRARSAVAEHADEGRPEQVLRHEREMLLHVDRVFQRHKRVDCICTKYRLSVRHMLFRMDEPVKSIEVLRKCEAQPEAWIADSVQARKVYHANLVLKVSSEDATGKWHAQLRKFRLILTREGIVRYETQEQTHGPANGGLRR